VVGVAVVLVGRGRVVDAALTLLLTSPASTRLLLMAIVVLFVIMMVLVDMTFKVMRIGVLWLVVRAMRIVQAILLWIPREIIKGGGILPVPALMVPWKQLILQRRVRYYHRRCR
jgi:hypothetical protein